MVDLRRLIGLLIVASLYFLPPAAHADQAFAPHEVLVRFRSGSAQAGVSGVRDIGTVISTLPAIGAVRMKVRPGRAVEDAVIALRNNPHVEYAEPNYLRTAFATPNDPRYAADQYGPKITRTNEAWDLWIPKGKVTIAIIDTGVQLTHPDLAGVLLKDTSGNVVQYNALSPTSSADDDHGHGTHCAGIAAAQINNSTGIAGMAGWNPAIPEGAGFIRVMPVKALNAQGSGTDAQVADGIVWAADRGARVISLSLGGPDYSDTLNNAVQYAWNKGCTVVAAAGNGGSTAKMYPAAYENVISVASTDSRDTLSSFSQYGSWVLTAAPGSSILSTYKGSTYARSSGTSMATPHVAGEAALIRSHNPGLSKQAVTTILLGNVDPYTPYQGREIAPGAGRINVLKALQAATVGSYSVTPDRTEVEAGATFSVSWTSQLPTSSWDWIGLFPAGDSRTCLWWKYTRGAASGTYALTAPLAGEYEFRYFKDNTWTLLAKSVVVTVKAPPASAYSLTATPASVTPGGSITVSWTSPIPTSTWDWIGLYRVGAPMNQAIAWMYTRTRLTGQGSAVFTAPQSAGQYEFRYFLDNGWIQAATSNTVTVGP